MRHIPNLITCLNLSAGFFSIIFAAAGDLVTASWLIASAMVFDFLDGFSARLLSAYSDIGRELDSLADLVSFGVAPAVILYKMITGLGMGGVQDSPDVASWIGFSVVIMPVFAAIRLAVFNLDSSQATSFRGLPTPANAMGVISLVIAAHYTDAQWIDSLVSSALFLTGYMLVFSVMMVTRLPLLSLKIRSAAFKGNEGRYLLALMLLSTFALFGFSGAPFIIPAYIVASVISRLF